MPENKNSKKGLIVALILITIVFAVGYSSTKSKNKDESPTTVFESVSETEETKLDETVYYEDIISDYQKIIEASLSTNADKTIDYSDAMKSILSDEDIAYKWDSMSSELIMYNTSAKNSFGYAIKDLNQDNVAELFLIDKYYNINAIFTVANNEAVLADAFWSRYRGEIINEQHIHIIGSSGADDNTIEVLALSDNGTLRTIKKSSVEAQTTDFAKWAGNEITFFE